MVNFYLGLVDKVDEVDIFLKPICQILHNNHLN